MSVPEDNNVLTSRLTFNGAGGIGTTVPRKGAQPEDMPEAGETAIMFTLLALFVDPQKVSQAGLGDFFLKILGLGDIEEFEDWQQESRRSGDSPETIATRQNYTPEQRELAERVIRSTVPMASLMPDPGRTLLNPELIKRMERDPQIKRYVELTINEAESRGLDGNMMANQFWQESRFNPRAKSGVGARGIAQFMPDTGKENGLRTDADFFDPEKSIRAGVKHMADLTQRYGSQQLALVAYNGGGRAITHANLGSNATISDWMEYMEGQRQAHGTGDRTKWRVQTYEYVQHIDSRYWSNGQQQEARVAMASLRENNPQLAASIDRPALTAATPS